MKNVLFLLFLCLFPFLGWAEQLHFTRDYVRADVVLRYVWEDHSQNEQELAFKIPAKDAALGNVEFQPFSHTDSTAFVIQEVTTYAKKISSGRQHVVVKPAAGGFEVIYHNIPAHRRAFISENITRIQEEAVKAYAHTHFYTMDGVHYAPDHARIARRYTVAMTPVARAFRQQLKGRPARDVINHILSWFQSIPYDQLLDRNTSNGAGFQTPYGLLINNSGDCDTKSVAMAALLRQLYPRQRLMMVYVPDHAFIAIQMKPEQGDSALRIDGSTFVLLDPTGPAQLKLGMFNERYRENLLNKDYTYKEIPF